MSLGHLCLYFTLESSLSWYLPVSLEDRGARWDQLGLEFPRREAAPLEGFCQPVAASWFAWQRTVRFRGCKNPWEELTFPIV